mmetsp:Transcript_20971/g.17391  ORF Transcript_20971/g.17391 Transcript_20971/m.17391 type:complete len:216 (+) Transcript_20971:1-648(+)
MTIRINFEGSDEIGCFFKLTNKYCLLPKNGPENFNNTVRKNLSSQCSIVECSISNTKLLGSMTQGNSKGLILPNTCTDQEFKDISAQISDKIEIIRTSERLNTLGNIISCNDSVALLHPDVDNETEELIQRFLGVEVFRATVGGQSLVGSYCRLNNNGGLVHPMTSLEELEELSNLLGISISAGSINKGSENISGGLVVNDQVGFCGRNTTFAEL